MNRYFSMNLVLLVSMIMLQGGVAVEVVEGGVVEAVEDRYIVIQLLVAVHFGQCLSKFCVLFSIGRFRWRRWRMERWAWWWAWTRW